MNPPFPVIDPALLGPENNSLSTSVSSPHAPTSPSTRLPISTVEYSSLDNRELKQLCKKRGLKVGGRKVDLVSRLRESDRCHRDAVPAVYTEIHSPSTPGPPSDPLSTSTRPVDLDPNKVLHDSQELAEYFDLGLRMEGTGSEQESDEEPEEAPECEDCLDVVVNEKTENALEWADRFILETRRKGGRQTETSVLNQWKAWTSVALNLKQIPDIIIDSNHMIEYLKYAGTRNLFTTRGKELSNKNRLSASSLKKIMTMLGRVRRRQEDDDPSIKINRPAKTSRTDDFYRAMMVQAQRNRLESLDFDVTRGTILDSQLRPEQFDEVTQAIFLKLDQIPSVIKAHFTWTWQCATLNRSDEVASLLLGCIHPFYLALPNDTCQLSSTYHDEFGVLAMYHETKTAQPGKTEPKYSFVLPHRNPLMCPVGAIAIMMHYMFDQADIMSRVAGWDWQDVTSWRMQHVTFGKTVDKPITGDALGKMYASFLEHTSITSRKKTHLARRTMPPKLEDMGVPPDQVEAVGHWQGNVRREVYSSKIPKAATVALAGFPVGESYNVPWAHVSVPEPLQQKLFPFCENEIAKLRAEGCKNQGMFNLLILLQKLRPFFWRAIGAINSRFPTSPVIRRLNVLSNNEAQNFLRDWPSLCAQEEAIRSQDKRIESSFNELSTRNAFSSVSSQLHTMKQFMEATSTQLSIISRRTEPFSPSKSSVNSSPVPIINPNGRPQTASVKSATPLIFPMPATLQVPTRPAAFSTPEIHQSSETPCDEGDARTSFHSSPLSSRSVSVNPPPCHAQVHTLAPSPSPSLAMPPALLPITCIGKYNVLHLTPLPPSPAHAPLKTPHDIILPPYTAFSPPLYPEFTTHNCTWNYIFEKVTNPIVLWETYAPGTLGDYPDIKALWQAWDEGTFIPDVGRKPALRLIDLRWGSLKNKQTNKGRFPEWRPRNDANARKIWSKFYHFVQAIEERISGGHSVDDAIVHFEHLRNGTSLSQFHKSTQKKRKHSEPNGNEPNGNVA